MHGLQYNCAVVVVVVVVVVAAAAAVVAAAGVVVMFKANLGQPESRRSILGVN